MVSHRQPPVSTQLYIDGKSAILMWFTCRTSVTILTGVGRSYWKDIRVSYIVYMEFMVRAPEWTEKYPSHTYTIVDL